MKKRAIISFANSRGRYYEALERLEKSLEGKFDGDFIGYRDEESIGAPKHLVNMYGFKIFGFAHARRMGFSSVLWLDSSVYAIDNVDSIFETIEKDGHIMQEAGCWVGEWANDQSLEYFGITRDEAMTIPCYGNAGFLGLDFTFEKSRRFFNEWMLAMCAGLFIGRWDNSELTESEDQRCKGHRHDLVVGSIIAHQLGMKYQRGDEILEYAAPEDPIKNDTIIFKAQGL